MADQLNYHSGWGDFNAGVSNLGNSLAGIGVGLAQQRYQQMMAMQQLAIKMQEMEQQRQLAQAHIGLFGAQASQHSAEADYLKQKTTDLTSAASSGRIMADEIGYLARNPEAAPEEKNAFIGDLLGRSARLVAGGNQHAVINVDQLLESLQPESRANLAAGGVQKRYLTLPTGATAVAPSTGAQIQAPFTLGAGQARYAGNLNLGAHGITPDMFGTPQPGSPAFIGPPAPQTPIAINTFTHPGADTPEGRNFGRWAAVYRSFVTRPAGIPEPTDPDYSTFKMAEDAMREYRGASVTAPQSATLAPTGAKTLSKEQAALFLQQADGDKEKARKLARDAGYQF